MPGGHRPFKEDPTSYNKTGIPCGNPERYESRGVIRMGQSDRPYRDQRLEAPVEDIQTEGERQLKALVKRQLDKDVTLESQLSRKKEFQSSSLMKLATAEVSGSMTLEAFRDLEGHDRRLEELQQYGLTQDEIRLTLEAEGVGMDGQPAKKSRYGPDPAAYATKLEIIQRKIAKKREDLEKPDHFRGTHYMSRHEMDLERAISHNRDKSRLLGMLMTSNRPGLGSEDPNDPINHLDSIMEVVKVKASKSRNPKLSSSSDGEEDEWGDIPSCSTKPIGYLSKNNVPTIGELCPLCRLSIPNLPLGEFSSQIEQDKVCCNCNQTFRDSSNNKQVKEQVQSSTKTPKVKKRKKVTTSQTSTGTVESIPEEVIRQYKLTLEQIQELPRFKDYHPGEPSKTLYLKNLSAKVTEEDLISLFMRFQKPNQPKIIYKLMTGRMRGQAFVTFDSDETATEALQLVNGYDFRGKPIIIQFGKKQ